MTPAAAAAAASEEPCSSLLLLLRNLHITHRKGNKMRALLGSRETLAAVTLRWDLWCCGPQSLLFVHTRA
jgi:hypothetical protein